MKHMKQYKMSVSRYLIFSFGLTPGDFAIQPFLSRGIKSRNGKEIKSIISGYTSII